MAASLDEARDRALRFGRFATPASIPGGVLIPETSFQTKPTRNRESTFHPKSEQTGLVNLNIFLYRVWKEPPTGPPPPPKPGRGPPLLRNPVGVPTKKADFVSFLKNL
ncbi:hypothetical protein CH352_14235 [Leptospira hartskeerlii]|uniref:Uncharacterized protein n=1 Tax=Leptospira hartskeerlii TaxID=2023177 RepID=A0A2M9X9V9_9LEPT|nr:hypothetical protein CH357_15270 [Leptospira hartskeerlii]PJZ32954.1 hypothetical protein CH352_14235 [Leptospira hartskeerlii]